MAEGNGVFLGLPGVPGYGLPSSKASTHTSGPLNNYKPTDAGLLQETSVFSHIGGRKAQEDRFCIVHKLGEPEGVKKVSFYGVFDGTVGDFASDTIKDLVIPALENTEGLKKYLGSQSGKNSITMPNGAACEVPANVMNGASKGEDEQLQIAAWQEECMRAAMRHMYLMADEELLRRAGIEEYHRREKPQHYAASTSVTLMLWNDLVCVGHLGDSRICLMYITDDQLRKLQRTKGVEVGDGKKGTAVPTREVSEEMVQGNFVTQDHKPDQPDERQRIEQCGGSVEYLHNHQNKPFIRGGDFQQRKILGESPMQLQYSR